MINEHEVTMCYCEKCGAPQPPEVDQWLPIEDAPKDGRAILLWDGEVNVAEWVAGKKRWETFFVCADNGVCTVDYPTHWMPLPADPTHKESK